MSFHRKSWPIIEENPYHNDEMDALVRWALRDSVAGQEPPPEIWDKIRARLEQPKAPSHVRSRFLSAQFSLLVQLLVLGIIILVAFGLSLRPGFDLSLDQQYVVNNDELTPQPGSEKIVLSSTDEDVPRGYLYFLLGRELTIFDYRLVPHADTYQR